MPPKRQKPEPDVPTWDTLAAALGITRRGLLLVRTRHGHDPDLPKAKAKGTHSVEAWRAFFAHHGIQGRQMDAESAGDGEASPAVWKSRQIEQQVIKLKLANELTSRKQIALEEIQSKLPPFLMAIRTELNQMVPELGESLEGIDDFHERVEILQARVNKLLGALVSYPWADEKPVESDSME